MDSIPEVFVVSDSANKKAACAIYDLNNGALLASFKEGDFCIAKKGLSFIGQDYIICASINKPMMTVWTLHGKNTDKCDMILPGLVNSMAVTGCGMYCAAGIDKTFFVWEVANGTLMSSVQHHTRPITCLRFSSDGSHLITGGKDGMVLVFLLSEVIAATESSENLKPRYQWLHHAAAITDIHVGSLGMFSRVATASKDMTCRIYELETGYLLTTIHVDFIITAITMDESEYFLLLGSAEGHIYRINMFAVNSAEVEYNSSDKLCAYLGHSKEITSLSVSTTGKYFLSGSEDCFCRVWDFMNLTCIRKMKFEGPVTNALITLLPPGMQKNSQYQAHVNVLQFKRSYEPDDSEIDFVKAAIPSRKLSLIHLGAPDEYFHPYVLNCSDESLTALNRNNMTEGMMSSINSQIYSFALSAAYDAPCDSETQEDDSD